ncbi:hypothetical protein K6V98_01650 [Collinsella sp. AGMB00827]|uniref:ATP-grasp domain-containing protein n=1 Tax=Collinsella ureilytica TaxID=2869515 RepID=A0ABS7MIC8_9ACTN|nr:hypothetical protein [Collinsella urealyticum]MBY4797068.1 hypothetical protein [Collinsella urealyticum]
MQARLQDEADVRKRLVPVVLGADILGYTFVREFHSLYGLTSIVLAEADVKATSSSRFSDYRILGSSIEDEDFLISYLTELGKEIEREGRLGIIVGSGDWYARLLSEHKAELEPWFVIPYISFDLLDRLTQKEYFYRLCEELNIPYPETHLFDCSDPDAEIPAESFRYPLIAKPSNSALYHYAEFPGKKKIFEVETPSELKEIFEAMKASSYDRELIVQDFIPGDDDGLRTISVFTDAEGDAVMTCSGRVVLQDHSPLAIGNPVVILSERVEPAIADACRLLKHVEYRGFANIDVKFDPRDGTYRFFEVNTRPGRNSFYVTLGGVDFVRLIVEEFVLGGVVHGGDATDEFAYACVPPMVVRRTVKDVDLRERTLAMYRSGKASFPLFYAPDSLVQRFWAATMYFNQIRKFKRYVWDTGGKQAASL